MEIMENGEGVGSRESRGGGRGKARTHARAGIF